MWTSRRTRVSVLVIAGWLLSGHVSAGEIEFDFKDPKGVNSVTFVLDSLLEPFMGVATGISGKVKFDPAKPKSLSGKIVIDVTKVQCANSGMTKAMQGEDWIDVAKYPTVEFSLTSVTRVAKLDDKTAIMTVVGNMKCKGVTQKIEVALKSTYLPDRMQHRMRGAKGDLLVLRSTFTISRKAFGIKPNMGPDVVADDIEVRVSIVGGHKKG